jgi:hypothetical protein
MSGGQEAVFMVNNWRSMEKNSRTFLPRLNGPIVTISNFGEWTLLAMGDNSIQILQHMVIKHTICGLSKNIFGGYPAGLEYDYKTESIVANGKAGTLQMYRYVRYHFKGFPVKTFSYVVLHNKVKFYRILILIQISGGGIFI